MWFQTECETATLPGHGDFLALALVSRSPKYKVDYLCVNKSQFVPVIFEPPCILLPLNPVSIPSRSFILRIPDMFRGGRKRRNLFVMVVWSPREQDTKMIVVTNSFLSLFTTRAEMIQSRLVSNFRQEEQCVLYKFIVYRTQTQQTVVFVREYITAECFNCALPNGANERMLLHCASAIIWHIE
jgi:hypothetical protein